jgi:hypothetical protein
MYAAYKSYNTHHYLYCKSFGNRRGRRREDEVTGADRLVVESSWMALALSLPLEIVLLLVVKGGYLEL